MAVSHLSLYVWGLDKNHRAQLVNTLHPGGRLQDVDWSRDGNFLAVASSDHHVYVYDTASWLPQPAFKGAESWVSNVVIAPDAETMAGAAWDNTIHVWSLSDRSRSQRLEGHDGWVRAVAFSPDGRLLASGGADKTIRLWDAQTGEPLGSVAGHDGIVYSVVFAPNGESILSGSADGTIKSWPLSAFLERTFELESVPTDVLASPDKKHILFALESGEVAVVDRKQRCVVNSLAGDAGKCRSMSCSEGRCAVTDLRR